MARSHLLKALAPARVSRRGGHSGHDSHGGTKSNTNTRSKSRSRG